MRLTRTAGIVLRQFYLLRGSPARVIPLFAWAGIDVVLWGFLTKYLNSVSRAGFNFVPALLGAVLFWDFFIRVMQGVTTAFLEDVWSRSFLNVFATPLTIAEYVSGLVLTSIATSSVGLLAMVLLATLVFRLSFFTYGIGLVLFTLVLFLFGIALGILASALVLRFGPASEWFIWPIPALLSPFAGVLYPVSILPQWMQVLARALPPSYVFENLRAIVSGRAASGAGLAASSLLAGIDIVFACWVFARVFRYTVRTGLLARYSAESIS